jgi:hypothetical protein
LESAATRLCPQIAEVKAFGSDLYRSPDDFKI